MEHDQVHDAVSFANYVQQLRLELNDPQRAATWENVTLAEYLGAMEAWARDWKEPAESNPWRHVADALTAAAVYE